MTPDALTVAMLRRLAAEPTAETFSDADLAAILERRTLDDGRGCCGAAGAGDGTDGAGTDGAGTGGAAGFDLYAAAADVWEQKAAALAQDFDFTADGADFRRSQAHAHALSMARLFRARRAPRSIFQTADRGPTCAGRETLPCAG